MKSKVLASVFAVGLVALLILSSTMPSRADAPAYWSFAPTPPMGWNSYDAFGGSVTEDEVMANARYMHQKLQSHGWKYVVVDYRWYDPIAKTYPHGGAPNSGDAPPSTIDKFGRLQPAPNRFPSSADGKGFKPLADRIHKMGLKFGIHIMRGISRQAVAANMPIQGSNFHAADAGNTSNTCTWCSDMYGVKADTAAGQAYYDALFRLYASWGVDFVKVDDLSNPYNTGEVEAIRKAIDKCGRRIVFSTSPGETPVADKDHVSTHANMWRESGDFWDNWQSLNHAFDLAAAWEGVGGPGHWPDLDMLCLGKIGIRSVGDPRMTNFTHDEQVTVMSLWCLAPSPLMLGMDLTQNDAWTLSLITNDEVLAIDQDKLGSPARRISQKDGAEVWIRDLSGGAKAVGFFNRSEADDTVTLNWSDAGLTGQWTGRDLWQHKNLGNFDNQITFPVPKHGSVLIKLTK